MPSLDSFLPCSRPGVPLGITNEVWPRWPRSGSTVATTTWGIKQIQLMLFHDRAEIRESLGGGDLLRMRVPVPAHLVGTKPSRLNVDGKILIAGISRGGGGFLPTDESSLQAGDFLVVMLTKDGTDTLDDMIAAPTGEHA